MRIWLVEIIAETSSTMFDFESKFHKHVNCFFEVVDQFEYAYGYGHSVSVVSDLF